MAQTTNAITFEDCKVEFSLNGTNWTDVSGMSNSVEIGGGERQTGETYTFDGDFAIIRRGKAQPFDITFRCVYTEVAADAFDIAEDAYEQGVDLYARWSPKGGGTGDYQYAIQGVLTTPPYPQGEAGSGDPVLFQVVVKCGIVTRSVVT